MNKTPKQLRNEKLGASVCRELKKRGFEAFYCENREEAVETALSLIPEESCITFGGSDTIRSIGLIKRLHEGNYEVLDRDLVPTMAEKEAIYRRAFSADVFLSSTNALSEDGVLVNMDGNGNRVAAMIYGPKRVIVIAGVNKIVKTPEDAIRRTRNTAAPINMQRFDTDTPCHCSGVCSNCKSASSICAYLSVMRLSRPIGRICVILVGEELGY